MKVEPFSSSYLPRPIWLLLTDGATGDQVFSRSPPSFLLEVWEIADDSSNACSFEQEVWIENKEQAFWESRPKYLPIYGGFAAQGCKAQGNV